MLACHLFDLRDQLGITLDASTQPRWIAKPKCTLKDWWRCTMQF